jgi:hypothetical protein
VPAASINNALALVVDTSTPNRNFWFVMWLFRTSRRSSPVFARFRQPLRNSLTLSEAKELRLGI